MSINWAPLLWDFLLASVHHMERLLGWIQETPAGLKLNSQVSHVLSSFFRYHLHLCRTYVLSWSIHPIKYLPCLAPFVGATVFIGVFVDILSLITIHLRCFHLYGHRLSSLSWAAIKSTFYAFQEKKWNPLRHRVDYVHLDFRQRLFATLEFLFLVALLPTIAVYCLVFSGLFIVFDSICKLLVYGVEKFQQTLLGSQKALEKGK
jgi:phosphatidylinositol glycan class Q protein